MFLTELHPRINQSNYTIMRTFHYKTLNGFMRANGIRQFTLEDFRSGRIYSNRRGWINFKLGEQAENDFVRGVTAVLWQNVDDERMYRVRYARSMGILRRLWYNGKRFEYCAGQDYPSEIRFIRRNI